MAYFMPTSRPDAHLSYFSSPNPPLSRNYLNCSLSTISKQSNQVVNDQTPSSTDTDLVGSLHQHIVCRSTKVCKPPNWLQSYAHNSHNHMNISHTSSISSNICYPTFSSHTFQHYPSDYIVSMANVNSTLKNHSLIHKHLSMNTEIEALELNDTWEIPLSYW